MNMNNAELNNLLGKIGKRVFVKYFREFEDFGASGLSNQVVIALLQSEESFTPSASATRTANARRIFRERLEEQALSIIAESGRVEPEFAEEAGALLTQLRLRRRRASSAIPRSSKA